MSSNSISSISVDEFIEHVTQNIPESKINTPQKIQKYILKNEVLKKEFEEVNQQNFGVSTLDEESSPVKSAVIQLIFKEEFETLCKIHEENHFKGDVRDPKFIPTNGEAETWIEHFFNTGDPKFFQLISLKSNSIRRVLVNYIDQFIQLLNKNKTLVEKIKPQINEFLHLSNKDNPFFVEKIPNLIAALPEDQRIVHYTSDLLSAYLIHLNNKYKAFEAKSILRKAQERFGNSKELLIAIAQIVPDKRLSHIIQNAREELSKSYTTEFIEQFLREKNTLFNNTLVNNNSPVKIANAIHTTEQLKNVIINNLENETILREVLDAIKASNPQLFHDAQSTIVDVLKTEHIEALYTSLNKESKLKLFESNLFSDKGLYTYVIKHSDDQDFYRAVTHDVNYFLKNKKINIETELNKNVFPIIKLFVQDQNNYELNRILRFFPKNMLLQQLLLESDKSNALDELKSMKTLNIILKHLNADEQNQVYKYLFEEGHDTGILTELINKFSVDNVLENSPIDLLLTIGLNREMVDHDEDFLDKVLKIISTKYPVEFIEHLLGVKTEIPDSELNPRYRIFFLDNERTISDFASFVQTPKQLEAVLNVILKCDEDNKFIKYISRELILTKPELVTQSQPELVALLEKNLNGNLDYRYIYQLLNEHGKITFFRSNLFGDTSILLINTEGFQETALRKYHTHRTEVLNDFKEICEDSEKRKQLFEDGIKGNKLFELSIHNPDYRAILDIIPQEYRLKVLLIPDDQNKCALDTVKSLATLNLVLEKIDEADKPELLRYLVLSGTNEIKAAIKQDEDTKRLVLNYLTDDRDRIAMINSLGLVARAINQRDIKALEEVLNLVSPSNRHEIALSTQQGKSLLYQIVENLKSEGMRDIFNHFWNSFTEEQRKLITTNEKKFAILLRLAFEYNLEVMKTICYGSTNAKVLSAMPYLFHTMIFMKKMEVVYWFYDYFYNDAITKEKFLHFVKYDIYFGMPNSVFYSNTKSIFEYFLNEIDNPKAVELAVFFINSVPTNKMYKLAVPEFTGFLMQLIKKSNVTEDTSVFELANLLGLNINSATHFWLAYSNDEHLKSKGFVNKVLLKDFVDKYKDKYNFIELGHGDIYRLLQSVESLPTYLRVVFDSLIGNIYMVQSLVQKASNSKKFIGLIEDKSTDFPEDINYQLKLRAITLFLLLPEPFQNEEKWELIKTTIANPNLLNCVTLLSFYEPSEIPDLIFLFQYLRKDRPDKLTQLNLFPLNNLKFIVDKLNTVLTNDSNANIDSIAEFLSYFKNDSVVMNTIREDILKRLIEEASLYSHGFLADSVLKNLNPLGITEDSLIAQQAMNIKKVAVERSIIPLLNPYQVISYHREMLKNSLTDMTVVQNVENENVSIDLKFCRKVAESKQFNVKDLPSDVTQETLNALIQSLEKKIASLSKKDKAKADKQMLTNLKSIKDNFADPFFQNLLTEIPKANGEISDSKYFFFVSLKRILDLAQEVEQFDADQFFARSDKTFISLLGDLFNDSNSLTDNIESYYNVLPIEYKNNKQILNLDSKAFLNIWNDIKDKINKLPLDQKNQVLKQFNSITGKPFDYFLNIMDDQQKIKPILELLDSSDQTPEKVKLSKAIERILDYVDVLTPAEQAFISMSESIQMCSTGKKSGLREYYETLPPQYKISSVLSSDSSELLGYIETLVDNTVQDAINNVFYNDDLLREVTLTNQDSTIFQPTHQAAFLKNQLAPYCGLKHEVEFDTYTSNNLNINLALTPQKELFDIFLKHYTPKLLVDALVRESVKLHSSSKESSRFYNATMRLLENIVPFPARNAEKYYQFDDDYNPIGLTEKGALKLLQARGYITNPKTSSLKRKRDSEKGKEKMSSDSDTELEEPYTKYTRVEG